MVDEIFGKMKTPGGKTPVRGFVCMLSALEFVAGL